MRMGQKVLWSCLDDDQRHDDSDWLLKQLPKALSFSSIIIYIVGKKVGTIILVIEVVCATI